MSIDEDDDDDDLGWRKGRWCVEDVFGVRSTCLNGLTMRQFYNIYATIVEIVKVVASLLMKVEGFIC